MAASLLCLSIFGMWGLVILLAMFSHAAATTTDPCEAIATVFATGGLVRNSEALACLKSFPYNPVLADAIIETLVKTYDLHVYKDISKDSPTPEFPMKVDVLGGLSNIGNTTYDNDYEFNKAIYSLVNGLNDGHAVYAPYCYYEYIVTYTAFPLVSVYDGEALAVQISPALNLFADEVYYATETVMGISLTDYAGATVVSINGMAAVDYAVQFADTQGTYKDLNARYNTAFSRYAGTTSLYYGGLCALPIIAAPQADNMTFVVQRVGSTETETLVVPFFAVWEGGSFTSAADYWTKYCYESSPLDEADDAVKPVHKPSKQHMVAKMPHKDIHHKKVSSTVGERIRSQRVMGAGPKLEQHGKTFEGQAENNTVYVLVDSYVSTYLLGDNITGVMVIPDFEGSGGDYSGWQADIYTGAAYLLEVGATRLILDLQDNGGGFAYLSYILVEFLFPGVVEPQYPVQNPATQLIQRMVTKSNTLMEQTKYWLNNPSQYNWAFDSFAYPASGMLTSSSEYFFPVEALTFGGATSNYSSLYSFPDRLASPLGIDELIFPVADTTPLFQPSNVLILTNGGCYSTCSLFSYVAQEIVGVKVATVGGIPNLPMAYSAGSAGYSYTLAYLLAYDVGYLGFGDDADAPKPLPVQATVGYTAAQAYCRDNSTIPADFVFKGADYRIPFSASNVLDILTLYYDAAALF